MRHIMIFLDDGSGAQLVAPKLATPYHLLLHCEQLLTSRFHTPSALIESQGSAQVREAWTDIGDVSAGRRADETF